jgi:hypothetical protein
MQTSKIRNIDVMHCWLWPRQMTDPSSRQRGRPTLTKLQLSDSIKNLVSGPRLGLTPRLTYQVTVGRNVTFIWDKDRLTAYPNSRFPQPLQADVGMQLETCHVYLLTIHHLAIFVDNIHIPTKVNVVKSPKHKLATRLFFSRQLMPLHKPRNRGV